MLPRPHKLIAAAASLALLAGAAAGKNPPRRDPTKVLGSKTRQLLLKQRLQKSLSGTLLAELNRNKAVYFKLNPQQLRDLREKFYMFKKQNPDRKVEILEVSEKFLGLTAEQKKIYRQRAAWLEKVVASLTDQQREQLKKLTPAERAKRLLELKARLVGAGKQPTTRPAK